MVNHLDELMGDAELYGFEPIHAFHSEWLQQFTGAWLSHVGGRGGKGGGSK